MTDPATGAITWAAIVAAIKGVSTATWIAVSVAVASTVATLVMAPKKPQMPEQTEADPGYGRKINSCSTQEKLKVVYGLVKVGGNDVFRSTTGTDGRYLWIVQTLAEGECEGINQVDGVDQAWLGDKLASEFGALVTYWFHSGSASQTVDANLQAAFPEWNDPLRNTCYIVWKLEFDPNYFQSLPTRMVELKGRLVYDPRGPSTAYSTNHALCLRDFMTNTRYGIGLDATKLDDTTWGSAATYIGGKGWALNLAIYQDEAAGDIRDRILDHCRCAMIWYDSKYYLRYADLNLESVVMTLSEEHIVQDESGKAMLSISEPSRFSKPDAVRVMFTDPTKNWANDDVVIGDETGVVKQIDLVGCTDREEASNQAVYYLERWKLDRTIGGRFRDDCLKLEPHDLVQLSFTNFGLADQYLRVQEASILPDGLIDIVLEYESLDLYDDDYDLDIENAYTCNLPDPAAEPPSVANVVISEESYNYRLRSFTRIKITFDWPPTYVWFDHVEVWLSYDDTNWEHLFDSTSDFEIANVEEGKDYYIRLKSVSIWGAKQQDANDWKVHYLVGGYTQAPDSPLYLFAVVNSNSINLYADIVDDTDIQQYEFRLGTSWNGGIFLASLNAPNLSLYGVKPGSHTFYLDTLGNNGQYGDTPQSATVALPEPPPGWTIVGTETIDTLITNGDMELNSDWTDVGSPSENVRSSTQKHDGTYSRKFTVDAANEGIKGAVFTTIGNGDYGWSAWVYPDDGMTVRVKIRKGDNSGFIVDVLKSGLTQDAWNFVYGVFTEGAGTGGAGAYIEFEGDTATSGSWYVDDVCLMPGTFTNAAPTLYGSEAYVRGVHASGNLVAGYLSAIIDRGSSAQELVYINSDIVVTGVGTSWDDVAPLSLTWGDIDMSRAWSQIFEIPAGPSVAMSLFHGTSSPPTEETGKMEILSTLVTARYYQVEVTMTDPIDGIYALMGAPTVKCCQ